MTTRNKAKYLDTAKKLLDANTMARLELTSHATVEMLKALGYREKSSRYYVSNMGGANLTYSHARFFMHPEIDDPNPLIFHPHEGVVKGCSDRLLLLRESLRRLHEIRPELFETTAERGRMTQLNER